MAADEPADRHEGGWGCGWEGQASSRHRRMAMVPLTEKLKWLEQMHRLALTLRDARVRARRAKPQAPIP